MSRSFVLILSLLCLAWPAWADETDDPTPGPVTMEWEGSPSSPPPNAWIGAGLSWGTQAQTHGGQPWGAGAEFSWVTHTPSSHHTWHLTHRVWQSPSSSVENRLMGKGVTEGVQSYWAGRTTLSSLTKYVNAHKQESHFGLQAGWRLQCTQHVGEITQNYLLREHDLFWGPQWALHLGPSVHVGWFKTEEAFRVTGFTRYLVPIFAELKDSGEGVVLSGKMWDPVETVAPELDVGVSMGGRMDPYYLELNLSARMSGPSVLDESRGRDWWRTTSVVDVAVSKAF